MDFGIEIIFFLVFFVPMGILVALNILLNRTLPDVAAPWVRLAGPAMEPEPVTPREAPLPGVGREPEPSNDRGAEPSNEEDALEAA